LLAWWHVWCSSFCESAIASDRAKGVASLIKVRRTVDSAPWLDTYGKSVTSVVRSIRAAFDRMFWRQYADEIRRHPEAPAVCCVLGMSQVSIVLFLFALGLLAPLVRLLRYIVSATGIAESSASGFNLRWFLGMSFVAFVLALFVSFRLYWHYRLTPDRATMLDPKDRDETTITVIKLTGSALAFMALMIVAFR
jgi:hypothetical protein